MHGRLWGLVPAVLLLALAFAGCMDQGPSFQNAGATEVSARRNVDLAASAAKAWDASAQLTGIGASETTDPRSDAPADPNVGNGLARSWSYVFQNAKGDSKAFQVSADGTVVSKNESDAVGEYAGSYATSYQSYRSSSGRESPVGNWTWDSDAALAVAMKNETFRAAAHAPNATLIEGLGSSGGTPGWGFVATANQATVVALVNATNGELEGIHDVSRYSWQDAARASAPSPPSKPAAESKSATNATNATPVHVHETGDLTPSAASHETTFTLDGPESGAIVVQLTPSGDVMRYDLTITGPGDVKKTYSGDFPMGQPQTFRQKLPDAAPGKYTVELSMETVQPLVPLASVGYDVAADFQPK